jgi:peptide/nickel transport system substrate-binding protein
MRPLFIALAFTTAAALLSAGSSAPSRAEPHAAEVLRISLVDFDYVDPALGYSTGSWAIAGLTCARLMRYLDRPGRAGSRIVPEVAAGWPHVSKDRKTYTFTIRRGFRFSSGAPITARSFVRAFERLRDPAQASPIGEYARDIASVRGRGRLLIVRLKRPLADMPQRMTMPFFCPVPASLPVDPEGIRTIPGSGPYRVARWDPGRRLVVERNRFYRGDRPHRMPRFDVYLDDDPLEVAAKIERGERDWGELFYAPALAETFVRLHRRYGVNRGRYFVSPSSLTHSLRFNTDRGIFRANARLRRAVNYALDRKGLLATLGPGYGAATDQYLPPVVPGFRDVRIYPAKRSLAAARRLARGARRDGEVVMYVIEGLRPLTIAQKVEQDLARIGLKVRVKAFVRTEYFQRLGTPSEPWDLIYDPWQPEYVDPYDVLNVRLSRGSQFNPAPLRAPRYEAALAAASRLNGRARYRAYGRLDVELALDLAPMAAFAYAYDHNLVAPRVGCAFVNATSPGALDLAAMCLKR